MSTGCTKDFVPLQDKILIWMLHGMTRTLRRSIYYWCYTAAKRLTEHVESKRRNKSGSLRWLSRLEASSTKMFGRSTSLPTKDSGGWCSSTLKALLLMLTLEAECFRRSLRIASASASGKLTKMAASRLSAFGKGKEPAHCVYPLCLYMRKAPSHDWPTHRRETQRSTT